MTLSPGAGRPVRECLTAVLLQLALLAAFFWTPISRYGEVHFSSADLTQAMSLTRIEPGHHAGNQLQSDAVTQMQPWLMFNRAELAAGRFPLWNPWNGAGCPHFANYQSAVVSPFSVPFYVLSFKAALLVSAVLKLLALGFFTYLFLREIGCGWLAANVGAVAFTFAGHNSLLLYFPHVGAMVALPAGLFCAERALRLVEASLADPARASGTGARARILLPCAGLTASLVVGLLAGNPEPLYFACWGVAAWITARVVPLWKRHRRDAPLRREVSRVAGALVLASVLAVGLSAFQVLPFLEYLEHSRVLEQRSLRQTPLDPRWWPLLLFPDVLGSPAAYYRISETIPPPNYEHVNMSYVGGAATLLALACPFLARGRRGALFFPIFALVWFVYAHDALGAFHLFELVPTLDMAPMNRSQGLWNFALAAATAVGLDALLKRTGARAWFGAGWLTVGGVVIVVAALIGADRLIQEFAAVPGPFHHRFLRFVPAHVGAMTLWTLCGVGAAAALLVVRARGLRAALVALVGAAVFAQGGWLLRGYNPVSPDALVFPRTEATEALRRHVGSERLAILGPDSIPPASNLAYGLNLLANYDGMWVRDLDLLYRARFGNGDNWRPILKGSHKALMQFGTRWVLAKWGWNFLDSGLRNFERNAQLVPVRIELLEGRAVTQTFQCYEGALSAVQVVLSTTANVRACTLRFRLEEVESGRLVSEQELSSHAVRATVHSNKHATWPGEWQLDPPGRPVVFRFAPQLDSAQRDYRITLACDDGRAADTVFAWHMPVAGYSGGVARHGARALPGEILFDWQCGEDRRYERVAEVGEYTLSRLRDAVPVYVVAERPVIARSAQEAFDLVRSVSFDPRRLVVLDGRGEATGESLAAEIEAARKRRIVQFSDSDRCYLVGLDGRSLAHIPDEATFLACRFEWRQIERLPAARRAEFTLVADSDLEGRRAIGLELAEKPMAPEAPPEVLVETPTRIRLRVHRERPGFLVVANTYDPGWKARLDGEDVPVLRANYAFQAIELPPGSWEIELRYWPDSLSLGLWLGAGSLLVGLGTVLLGRRARSRAP